MIGRSTTSELQRRRVKRWRGPMVADVVESDMFY